MSVYYSPDLDMLIVKHYKKAKVLLRSDACSDNNGDFFIRFELFYYIGEF